jgi:hypothetical protein
MSWCIASKGPQFQGGGMLSQIFFGLEPISPDTKLFSPGFLCLPCLQNIFGLHLGAFAMLSAVKIIIWNSLKA